jgi:Flp pilus assembly protein TadD
MGLRRGLGAAAALAGLLCLGGCETSSKLTDLIGSKKSDDPSSTASIAGDPATTGSVAKEPGAAAAPGLVGSDLYDDLNMGKQFYRTGNYGLAERYFRRSVEEHPRDAESWVGLAAAYDQLKRFELADRAYAQAIGIVGETPELLNNKGFSYILRGDYGRAREILVRAQAMDPSNPYIQNNLELLTKSVRKGKGIAGR